MRRVVPCLVPLLCALVLVGLHSAPYLLKVGIFVGLATLQAMSLNIIWGFGGQFSMGQMALSAVAAYSGALSVTLLGWNPWLALLPALGAAAVATLGLGLLALRLKGFYFSVVTLAFAQVLLLVLYNADLVGGPSGMVVAYRLPDIAIAGVTLLRMNQSGIVIFLGSAVAVLLLANTLVIGSRLGRAIIGVREEEVLARAIGIAPSRTKILAFLLSSVPAALAGWMLAPIISYLSPTSFGVDTLLDQICMVVIGGAGSVFGPFAGAVVVVVLPEMLRFAGAMRVVGYSVVLILTVIFAPRGLVGLAAGLRPRRAGGLEAVRAPLPPQLPQSGGLLEIRDVSKRFSGLVAVAGVSLRIGAGEVVGLIGPNGAGKTTLFDMISGFAQPTQGEIFWRGSAIGAPEQLAHAGLVRTFQHARLFANLTTAQNLLTAAHLPGRGMLGQSPAERVGRILQLCHLEAWADTQAGRLPYGVSKRLGVAIGLITEPMLLLLDEPAAGLTLDERQALAALLERISQLGVAMLVIEHDIGFVANVCGRIIVLSAGRVICDGSIEDARADPAVVEAYLGGVARPTAKRELSDAAG